ncbi:MAG: stealth family protein [Paludibacter sp.]|nr:stealth family protein [Bacteroidales bacterium]MCM1068661.1 stealth family protein [Prevotella sp.]MCM1353325.1 stealth family protein [Bacteroides sp.]MCM1442267.1 stealth family protein [Muribaculum sp.]MCM1481086.1 stealth family protein [Paludibacter sp.]
MDAVITYVNGLDPIWQQEYSSATCKPVLVKRYRDWGLLPYLLRGIERNMPFVERVFLVVSGESQVPAWADTTRLRIVYHRDIIPAQYLPTFNSTTIELFLHCIPDLSEQFVYFNDDCFPVAPLCPTDLFADDKIVVHLSRHLLAVGMYKKQTRQSDRFARCAAGVSAHYCFVRPQHTCTPMLKSNNAEVYARLVSKLTPVISRLRSNENVNQYVYTDYLYYTGRIINKRISTKHCSMAAYSADAIVKCITHPRHAMVCINDVSMNAEKQEQMRIKLHAAFVERFPSKSRFEK